MKGQLKKLKRLKEQEDRLKQFDQEYDHYEEKDIGGEVWVKSYNGGTNRWQVSIYTPPSFRRYKQYSENRKSFDYQMNKDDFNHQ